MRIIFSELRNYENIALQQSFLLPPFLSVLKKKPTCLTLAWIETIWRLFIYHPTDKWKLRKILWYLSIFKLPGNPLECLLFMAYLIEGRYVLNVNVFDFYVRESYISGKSFMKFPVTYEVRTCDISDPTHHRHQMYREHWNKLIWTPKFPEIAGSRTLRFHLLTVGKVVWTKSPE